MTPILDREEAIRMMNLLADNRTPFVFIINYAQDGSYIIPTDSIPPSELLYNLNGYTNSTVAPPLSCRKLTWHPRPESFADYCQSFEHVKRNILRGNSFLTNLTCMTPVNTDLSLKEIYLYSHAIYKIWLKDAFTCFSPETFVRIIGRHIYSYPMKGTIDAGHPDAHRMLMDDPKEQAEHATIVDLIRNDLSMVADHVTVTRYRYAENVPTHSGNILQTSSEIRGTLPEDYRSHLGEILFKLLPAGSITGAPKRKTLEIIAEAERYDRGFYTGIAGYFDGNNLDSAVMIRFVENSGATGTLHFKSGGGITGKSDARKEYEEMIRKIYVPICRNHTD